MQNQGSPAQLLFPTIPENYCPEGKWSDVFNSLIQLYLNNGTVNIPGLGLVTPQQIQTLQQNIQNLQNQFDALTLPVINRGSTNFTAGQPVNGKYNVVFNTEMPNTNYLVSVVPIVDSEVTSLSNNWSWGMVSGSNTTTGMSIYVYGSINPDNVTGFNWTVVGYPA